MHNSHQVEFQKWKCKRAPFTRIIQKARFLTRNAYRSGIVSY